MRINIRLHRPAWQPAEKAAYVIPSMTSSALSRDTCSVLLWVLLRCSLTRTLFLRDQGSFSNHSVKPRRFHHPSIRSRTATMITRSISPTVQGGRVPTQTHGLNHDHRMTRAALHGNPGSAAHSPGLRAASSTTAPLTPARWLLSPTLGTCVAPAADIRDATAAQTAPHSAPLPPAARAQRNSPAY